MSFKCRSGGEETASGEALDQAFLKTSDHPGFRFKVLAVGVDGVAPEDITPALKKFNKGEFRPKCTLNMLFSSQITDHKQVFCTYVLSPAEYKPRAG